MKTIKEIAAAWNNCRIATGVDLLGALHELQAQYDAELRALSLAHADAINANWKYAVEAEKRLRARLSEAERLLRRADEGCILDVPFRGAGCCFGCDVHAFLAPVRPPAEPSTEAVPGLIANAAEAAEMPAWKIEGAGLGAKPSEPRREGHAFVDGPLSRGGTCCGKIIHSGGDTIVTRGLPPGEHGR